MHHVASAQHSVHLTPSKVRWGYSGRSLRVFQQFVWLEAGSDKAALSRPAHQPVTRPVRRTNTFS